MKDFKVDDKVVRIADHCELDNETIYTVAAVNNEANKIRLVGFAGTYYAGYFKLYEEKQEMKSNVEKFDMKTNPWYIRVNNEEEFTLVQEWLKDNFCTTSPYHIRYTPELVSLTNTCTVGDVYPGVMWSTEDSLNSYKNSRTEIKINFKTIIDSVEYIAIVSEKDKKIRELQETIELAQKQIAELKGM